MDGNHRIITCWEALIFTFVLVLDFVLVEEQKLASEVRMCHLGFFKKIMIIKGNNMQVIFVKESFNLCYIK